MGLPPEGALNVAAWKMIRDLVGSDPTLNTVAWESLHGSIGMLPASETPVAGATEPLAEAAESAAVH